jgi:hypothetical protein
VDQGNAAIRGIPGCPVRRNWLPQLQQCVVLCGHAGGQLDISRNHLDQQRNGDIVSLRFAHVVFEDNHQLPILGWFGSAGPVERTDAVGNGVFSVLGDRMLMILQRWVIWLLATVALLAVVPRGARAADPDAVACEAAGAAAERQHTLPPGLLLAIGQVESGRRDPVTGRTAAWPWTINAGGTGHFYDTLAAALAAAHTAQAVGPTSIDVGCFQINLLSHPAAFANLEEAFDPRRNADYAARFLALLHEREGSWEGAVAAYHSATEALSRPYRNQVMARWVGNDPMVVRAELLPPIRPALQIIAGVRIWTPSARGSAADVIHIPPARGGRPQVLPVVIVGGR